MIIKNLAFLMDCPVSGSYMMFPDYAEDLQEVLKNYDLVDVKITDQPWSQKVSLHSYKVYKQKDQLDDKNTDRLSIEE